MKASCYTFSHDVSRWVPILLALSGLWAASSPLQAQTCEPASTTLTAIGGGGESAFGAPFQIMGGCRTGFDFRREFRFALEFDLSSIPANATVLSAELKMRTSRHDLAGQIAVYGYAGDGSITAGDLTAGNLLFHFTPTTSTAREAQDVTAFVAARLGNGDPWAGFALRQDPLGTTRTFWDCPNNTAFPQLVVAYTTPDNEPPTITVALSPEELWPPNHKMKNIHADVTADDNCPGAAFALTSITSDEDVSNDIQGADIGRADVDFKLRAERDGDGDGRAYTVTYTATDASGNTASASADMTVPHDRGHSKVAAEAGSPARFALSQNYPNPFNPTTTISFAVREAGEVTLAIYNVRGQLVRTLFAGLMETGQHSAVWDGTDLRGATVASGVYVYRLQGRDFIVTKKLVLAR